MPPDSCGHATQIPTFKGVILNILESARARAEVSRKNLTLRKSMAYRTVCEMQKQWEIEVVLTNEQKMVNARMAE